MIQAFRRSWMNQNFQSWKNFFHDQSELLGLPARRDSKNLMTI